MFGLDQVWLSFHRLVSAHACVNVSMFAMCKVPIRVATWCFLIEKFVLFYSIVSNIWLHPSATAVSLGMEKTANLNRNLFWVAADSSATILKIINRNTQKKCYSHNLIKLRDPISIWDSLCLSIKLVFH
jgi:hypothetical protein